MADTKLKLARVARGISLNKAARLARVSPSAWGAVERGKSMPAIDRAHRMAYVLGFTAVELWPPEQELKSATRRRS